MMAKKLFGFVLILVLLVSVTANAKVSKKRLQEREKFAAELISGDEEFLADYIDRVPEDKLMSFYEKAIKMAVAVADETVNIKNDDEAYEYIVNKVEGKGGVKDIIEGKVKQYLKKNDNSGFAKATSGFDISESPYYCQLLKIKENIKKIRLQKSVFSY